MLKSELIKELLDDLVENGDSEVVINLYSDRSNLFEITEIDNCKNALELVYHIDDIDEFKQGLN